MLFFTWAFFVHLLAQHLHRSTTEMTRLQRIREAAQKLNREVRSYSAPVGALEDEEFDEEFDETEEVIWDESEFEF